MNKKKAVGSIGKNKVSDKNIDYIHALVPAKRQKRRIFGVSGYMLYSKYERDIRYPEKITVTEIANMWSNLSDREKRKWNEKALRVRNRMYEELDKRDRERKKAKGINPESEDESEIKEARNRQKLKNKKMEEELALEKKKPENEGEEEDEQKPTQMESDDEN